MPAKSRAQARWAFANQDKPGKLGAAAKEFVPHGPGSVKALPARVGRNRPAKPRSPDAAPPDQQREIDSMMAGMK